jgi:Tfp pilus assembly PilM family ATPase
MQRFGVKRRHPRVPQRGGLRLRGWVGIDLGSHAIKLAQLERRNGRLGFAAYWSVPANSRINTNALESGRLSGIDRDLAGIRQLFGGTDCAAALSMSLVELRSMDLPMASHKEMRSMVTAELGAEDDRHSDQCFDFWINPDGGDDLAQVTALAASEKVVEHAAREMLRAGYTCRVCDGIPCALARASVLADPDEDRPAAIVDLGETCWTLVIASAGKPAFTRILRGDGLGVVIRSLQDGLQLSREHCTQLLKRYGLDTAAGTQPRAAEAIGRLVIGRLRELADEVERTLAYVASQFPAIKPQRMWLTGGGAAIPGLPALLQARANIPVLPWKLFDAGAGDPDYPGQFAVAAALSALRWEEPRCT